MYFNMTTIKPYSAECEDCGHVMPIKFSATSFSTFAPVPKMNLSRICDSCGSENIKTISSEEARDKFFAKPSVTKSTEKP